LHLELKRLPIDFPHTKRCSSFIIGRKCAHDHNRFVEYSRNWEAVPGFRIRLPYLVHARFHDSCSLNCGLVQEGVQVLG
jgi:hypothetical protein